MSGPAIRRYVVDTNQLDHEALRDYLSRSPRNHAVLCDYTAMEAFKSGTEWLFELLQYLCDYPQQVVVLKGTRQVVRLSGRPAGLQRRLIHDRQTVGYPGFCEQIRRARAGDARRQKQLVDKWQDARHFLDDVLLPDAESLLGRVDRVVRGTFTQNEIERLRSPAFGLNRAIARKLITSVFVLASSLFQHYRDSARWPPDVDCFRNIYHFRFALCMYTFMLEWVSTGSNVQAKTHRVRNDMIDVGVAAYATYFDGLLSKDGRANRIHDHAATILRTALRSTIDGDKRVWLEQLRRESKELAELRYPFGPV